MEYEPLNSEREIVTRKDNDKIAHILTALPVVIKNILKFLPARDLCCCSQVCSTWNNIVTSIKNKRNNVLFIRMNSVEKERFFHEILQNCWSEPNLVMVFGPLGINTDVEFDILNSLTFVEQVPSFRNIVELNRLHIGRKLLYVDMLKQINSCMNTVQLHLPKKCHLIRVPITTFCKLSNNNMVVFNPLTSLVISSMPGVEMGVFSIPSTTVNINVDIELEKLYVPKPYSTSKNYFKCVLLFDNSMDGNGMLSSAILAETPMEKYISDKTIIVGGRLNCLPISTGITFGGENVEIECIHLAGNECCTRNLLVSLKRLGFHEKMGVAFLLSSFISQKTTCSLFQELFPNFLLLGIVCEDNGLVYPDITTNISVGQCDICGRLLSTRNSKVPSSDIIIFIMLKTTHKIVDL